MLGLFIFYNFLLHVCNASGLQPVAASEKRLGYTHYKIYIQCRENKIYKLLKKHTQNEYLRKKNGTKTFESALQIEFCGALANVDFAKVTFSTKRGKCKIYKIDISKCTTKSNLECTLKCFRSIFLA